MIDREKVIKAIDICRGHGFCNDCSYCLSGKEYTSMNCRDYMLRDVLTLLKEQKVRKLTMDEWREWKNNPKRNPICELWEHDTSPMWVLNPDIIHEPALLMGKLKLFTGKPTFEQCNAVKWE